MSYKYKSQSANVYSVLYVAGITDVAELLLYCSGLLSTLLYIDFLLSVNRFSKNPGGVSEVMVLCGLGRLSLAANSRSVTHAGVAPGTEPF